MAQHSQERPGNIVLAALRVDLCQTTEQLADITGISRRSVAKAAGTLIASGYAMRREVGCYVLSEEGLAFREGGGEIKDGPNGPHISTIPKRLRKVTSRDKIWSAMRMERKFTVDQLITLSSCTIDSARKFIGILTAHGYLQEVHRRSEGTALTSPGFKRWILVKDTGPDAPVWRSCRGELFDRNLNQVVTP